MKTVEEIQNEISALPHGEYMKLAHWFSEQDWELWDDEIERDALSGKLDFLIDEAMNEKIAGKLRDL